MLHYNYTRQMQGRIQRTTMSKILSAISRLTTLVCAGFLLFIGLKCLAKLNDRLKGANVGIVKTSTQPYPGITICPLKVFNENEKYEDTLKDCELTLAEYFENGTWYSTKCNDPIELYDKIVGTIYDLIHEIEFELEDKTSITNVTISNIDNPSYPDDQTLGRCFTASIPKQDFRISKITIVPLDAIEVKIHAPGNLFDEDNIYWHLFPDSDDDVDITYEVFEVLDFDGENCKTYETNESRDQCVIDFMVEKTIEVFNCTTPFLGGPNATICSDQNVSMKVLEYYEELKSSAISGKITECPMACKYLMINFGRFSKSNLDKDKNETDETSQEPRGSLKIKFRKFIKHATVSYTYQGLEFFAEFGGYLGLLLGMSLNQIPQLLSVLTKKVGLGKV